MKRMPMPLEWHPFYRDKTWLLDWLERRGPYADLHDIRIPRPVSLSASWTTRETEPSTLPFETILMTRRRAWGPAPYVGRPFHYEWPVGEDHLRRYIAGEARIVYEELREETVTEDCRRCRHWTPAQRKWHHCIHCGGTGQVPAQREENTR